MITTSIQTAGILDFGALINALAPLADIVADKVMQRIQEHDEERKPRLYTPSDVCDILHISTATLWRYEKAGIIKPCIVGGSKLYEEESLQDAIATGKVRKYARRTEA